MYGYFIFAENEFIVHESMHHPVAQSVAVLRSVYVYIRLTGYILLLLYMYHMLQTFGVSSTEDGQCSIVSSKSVHHLFQTKSVLFAEDLRRTSAVDSRCSSWSRHAVHHMLQTLKTWHTLSTAGASHTVNSRRINISTP